MHSIIVGAVVITVIMVLWGVVYSLQNPIIEEPDGVASVNGCCGTTTEISLKFKDNKVIDSTHHTNGCGYSLTCIDMAVKIAIGKTPEEVLKIDSDLIQKSVGGLPKDHMHCADLAEQTLHMAVEDYLDRCKQVKN